MSLEGKDLGHYHLQSLLGSGGMGHVYLAEDMRIGHQVAIKVIYAEAGIYLDQKSIDEAVRLAEREAKAIARLDHPNILSLYAYGKETLHEQLLIYLVMPYRKEGTLDDWLQRRGKAVVLSPREVVPLVQQAAAALQHAHDQQVIHQDIKPSNFLIRLHTDQSEGFDLLLADFGIAKVTTATMTNISQGVRGTPTYMAPEQWDGQPVPATDQYALAVMVYLLLVGQPPFQGGLGKMMYLHYMTPPPVPSTLNSQLSAGIDAVLLRALSKQPNARFPSVLAFAQAFQEAVDHPDVQQVSLDPNMAEVESSISSYLTLPGAHNIGVAISDGTSLRLEGEETPYDQEGPASPSLLQQDSSEVTVPKAQPAKQVTPSTAINVPPNGTPATKRSKQGRSQPLMLGSLAGLMIVALASGIIWFTLPRTATTLVSTPTRAITPSVSTTKIVTPTLTPTPTPIFIPTPTWVKYTESSYTLKYPQDWEVQHQEILVSFNSHDPKLPLSSFIIDVQAPSPDLQLTTLLAIRTDGQKSTLQNSQQDNSMPPTVSIGGNTWHEAGVTGDEYGEPIKYVIMIAQHPASTGKIFTITLVAKPSSYKQVYESIFKPMLASFKFS